MTMFDATPYVEWNSQAVAFLQNGDSSTCIDLIRQTLCHLKTELIKMPPPAQVEDPAGVVSRRRHPGFAVAIQSIPIDHFDVDESHPSIESNMFPLYSRAFVLSGALENRQKEARALTVLLYNLALANHLEALRMPRLDYCYAEQVLRMYQAAMDAAKDLLSADDADDLQCLILAITNNLGHMHSSLGNYLETKASVSLLRDIMEYTGIAMNCRQAEESDFLFFYKTVFVFLEGQTLSRSPAA